MAKGNIAAIDSAEAIYADYMILRIAEALP